MIASQTVIARGFSARADRDNFLFGPTGLALDTDGTLYVTDGYDEAVTAIDDALTRTTPVERKDDAVGRVITRGGLLNWPLAMMWVPGHHLLVANGRNGEVVEIDPAAKKQVYAQWIDNDAAQQPPGNGDLFGLAMTQDGKGFYYVEDDMNTLFSRREAMVLGATGALLGAGVVRAAERMLHQPGIVTPQQPFAQFLALDLVTDKRADVAALMKRWTEAADALMAGRPVSGIENSGETDGLSARGLTITFGFGPGLFVRDGVDRFGLAAQRPAPLADLPRFTGDQFVAGRSGGDLCIQACANDPQTALHAVRTLMRVGYGTAEPRWIQAGFLPSFGSGRTPRNLMGFRDGTINPDLRDPRVADRVVWAAPDDRAWMQGGSYLVARIIRIAMEHWDRMKVGFQEETMGRRKQSGAPINGRREHDPLTLAQTDRDGNPVTAQNAHARLAAPEENGGAQILRRGYSYDNGMSFTAERWPPWHQGMELDTGLLFLAYQQDPRAQFTRIFERMAKFDMLNQFVTHVGGGLFACPGRAPGGYIGQALLESRV